MMICPVCSVEAPEEDRFCESCGAQLGDHEEPEQTVSPESLCSCGAPAEDIDEDGFCLGCGKRIRRPPSDHVELALGEQCAAVSDRGLRHAKNEDRFALGQGERATALVVCDGVSATRDAEAASQSTVDTIASCLQPHLAEEDSAAAEAALRSAIAAAQEACRASRLAGEDSPPSTTVVAAIASGTEVTVAWLGDSRAYWITSESVEVLTRDHSWAEEALASGDWTPAEIASSPHAHAITRWIGADADPSFEAEVARYTVEPNGVLVLCSDGLWNYLQDAQDFRSVVWNALQGCDTLLEAARQLVTYANEQGGQDNVTVALWRPEPTQTAEIA